MDDAGILRSREVRRLSKAAWKQISDLSAANCSQPFADGGRVCSVIWTCTGRPVFFWTTVARSRTLSPTYTSSILSRRISQPLSLPSIARFEQSEVAAALLQLKAYTNRPDVLRLQLTLLTD
jgi:hypothetical protein